ncbi:hypothetical protein DDB_G0272026 [Dictyostelium discoideum AX4]|uniref:Uncharacterized protein n=1 Tax=Dictyostelium discoideum TaxID=44689 RepID=Q86JM1_DICDI|nr:hypothetical protein DDB_G0272026 [Dictyostelium discoideum AX4]EAL71447.1 hypothetical protein DDB_G0272026 [Dictyostelium discoideum AX4]|eukprot:XP_645387.1 hypothetical protein DDB_G0272026 [Dictyostelium discoideum AX4]
MQSSEAEDQLAEAEDQLADLKRMQEEYIGIPWTYQNLERLPNPLTDLTKGFTFLSPSPSMKKRHINLCNEASLFLQHIIELQIPPVEGVPSPLVGIGNINNLIELIIR